MSIRIWIFNTKEIGEKCIIDKSTTTTLLNKMEKMNFIEKQSIHQDKRSILIKLTSLGKQKAYDVHQICKKSDNLVLHRLSLENQQTLIKLLKELNNLLKEGDDFGKSK